MSSLSCLFDFLLFFLFKKSKKSFFISKEGGKIDAESDRSLTLHYINEWVDGNRDANQHGKVIDTFQHGSSMTRREERKGESSRNVCCLCEYSVLSFSATDGIRYINQIISLIFQFLYYILILHIILKYCTSHEDPRVDPSYL